MCLEECRVVVSTGAISDWSQLPRRHFLREFTFSLLVVLGLGSRLLEPALEACIAVRPMFMSLPASSELVFGSNLQTEVCNLSYSQGCTVNASSLLLFPPPPAPPRLQ